VSELNDLDDLPDKRRAIKGFKKDSNSEVLIRTAVSAKLYFCPGCNDTVEIGLMHTLVVYIDRSAHETHGHWHFDCMQQMVLPKLSSVEVIDADLARKAAVNKRLRNRRNRRARRAR
jgi:hypothetical protein